ncbi:hypothetical protein ACKFKF_19105 [Phormidesmis sp. 146-12]
MKNSVPGYTRKSLWRKATIALLSSTLLMGSYGQMAIAAPLQISQQRSWNAVLKVARLVQTRQDTSLVVQLGILDKPQTSYANAVYQVFARRNDQWVQIFTSTGARLISNNAGQTILAPEVISLNDLRRQLGDINLNNVELRVTAQLRYDVRGSVRDRSVFFEQTQSYQTIAQTTSSQLITQQISSQYGVNQGSFSLAIAQKQASSKKVVARVSVRNRTSQGFSSERFLGDFRYKVNKKAKFMKGLKSGDRVIVRLFNQENQFIGYSEFELLSENAAVTLVLPDRSSDRIVRTVYGIDTDQNGAIDSNTQIYDYFTQVSQVTRQSYQNARVTFFRSVRSLKNLSSFALSGLPMPRSNCVYPISFTSGAFSLVNQSIEVFQSNLSSVFVSAPGRVVQTIEVSSTNVSVYEADRLLTTDQMIDSDDDDDDDDDDKKGRKRRCNQGIGNGAEGCDPGNSRPRGGSNDED